MTTGLPVSRIVNVNVVLSPQAAAFANFNSLLIVGDSNIINTAQRIASYGSITEVAAAFGTNAPEYKAALLFFSQLPTPSQLYIGRWAQAAVAGILIGGALTPTEQLIATWQAVTTGAFKIIIDGSAATAISALNFSADANLNAVAARIQAAVRAIATGGFTNATVVWNGSQFVVTSGTTGAASAVAALQAPAAGVDISGMLKGTAGTLSLIVNGIAAETAVAAVTILDGLSTQWYGLTFAASTGFTPGSQDSAILAVAAYIEATSANRHVFGITTLQAAAVVSPDTTSIGYLLKAQNYSRSLAQYSSTTLYAVCSMFGRAFTVNLAESNSIIVLMFKNEPGVAGEQLTSAQANALDANNYNYFAPFNNSTIIVVNGQMASGTYFDEIWGLDWLANQIQTDVYNVLYSSTKIPQTNDGNHIIATQIEAACIAGVNNGLLAPGTWLAPGFGQLKQGDYLPKGYYVYSPPIEFQAQADREQRKSVPFQVAAKLAGAIQSVDVTVNVNR